MRQSYTHKYGVWISRSPRESKTACRQASTTQWEKKKASFLPYFAHQLSKTKEQVLKSSLQFQQCGCRIAWFFPVLSTIKCSQTVSFYKQTYHVFIMSLARSADKRDILTESSITCNQECASGGMETQKSNIKERRKNPTESILTGPFYALLMTPHLICHAFLNLILKLIYIF